MKNVQIIIESNLCSGCCSCLSTCPYGVIAFIYDKKSGHPTPFITENSCINCGACLAKCPSGSLLVVQNATAF